MFKRQVHNSSDDMIAAGDITNTEMMESDMQELVKLVLTKSTSGLDFQTKQNFLTIARSFYYKAYCNPGMVNFHLDKVLFEKVL